MNVDWIKLGAQLLNFVILVLLLRHFLYGRILGAVEERENRIASRLEEAEEERKEATEEAERHRREREEMKEERDEVLAEARQEAEERREELLAEARQEAERAREKWRKGLERRQEELLGQLRGRAATATYRIAEQALTELADVDLQRQAVDAFIDRLESEAEASDAQALGGADELVVETAFELEDAVRQEVTSFLKDRFDPDDIRCELTDDLVLGVRVRAGDHVLGWSVRDYLASLDDRVRELLDAGSAEESQDEDESSGETEGER